MFSGGICSNCNGCFAFGSCNDYDPSGELGPTNPTDCEQGGGIVCSDTLGLELSNATLLHATNCKKSPRIELNISSSKIFDFSLFMLQ